jgi:tetratricopeptide (TPR) repeat protein
LNFIKESVFVGKSVFFQVLCGLIQTNMHSRIFSFLILVFLFISCQKNKPEVKPENTYQTWADFVKNYPREMKTAEGIFKAMSQNGLKENSLTAMNFTFVSNSQEKLMKLSDFLNTHYTYTLEKPKQIDKVWEMNGVTNQIPITANNLLYWALDMYKRGFENDASFDTYNGLVGEKGQLFPILADTVKNYYAQKGMICYKKGDISGAISNLSLNLVVNPNDPNSYYARAIAKNDLYAWKAALEDYNAALSLAPDFVSALNNRGILLDEHGNFAGAIEDYNRILALKTLNDKEKQQAYFNRGNAKLGLKDKKSACDDWKMALELGMKEAKARMTENCN